MKLKNRIIIFLILNTFYPNHGTCFRCTQITVPLLNHQSRSYVPGDRRSMCNQNYDTIDILIGSSNHRVIYRESNYSHGFFQFGLYL